MCSATSLELFFHACPVVVRGAELLNRYTNVMVQLDWKDVNKGDVEVR